MAKEIYKRVVALIILLSALGMHLWGGQNSDLAAILMGLTIIYACGYGIIEPNKKMLAKPIPYIDEFFNSNSKPIFIVSIGAFLLVVGTILAINGLYEGNTYSQILGSSGLYFFLGFDLVDLELE